MTDKPEHEAEFVDFSQKEEPTDSSVSKEVGAEAPEQDLEFLNTFLSELEETVASLELAIMDLESNPKDADSINKTFRLFHNLKGASSMMGFGILQDIAHYTESVLDHCRSGALDVIAELVDLFLESIKAVKEVKGCIHESGKEGDNRYFSLLSQLAEVSKQASGSERESAEGEGMSSGSDKAQVGKSKVNDQIKLSRSVIEQMMLLVGEFMLIKNRVEFIKNRYSRDRDFLDSCAELDQFAAKFQRHILKLRLSPVGPVFDSMRRVVRSTAKQTGKPVNFEIRGKDTLLDRSILDVLAEPLMHMIRNSIDHGIENQGTRVALSKPDKGNVTLNAEYKSGEIHLQVIDDGKGLDSDYLKAKAIERGLLTEAEAKPLTAQEAFNIIFMPGFSGAAEVTETSGRGVGMDVVKAMVETSGGQIDILSEVNAGTTITLRFPLSLAIVDTLAFRVGEQTYTIPQANIEEVLSAESSIVQENQKSLEGGSKVLMVRDEPLPVLSLARIFKMEGAKCEAMIQIRHTKYRFILEVGCIVGPMSIVSQPLPSNYGEAAPFTGVTNQGDGSLLLHVDIAKLFQSIKSMNPPMRRKSSKNRGIAGTGQEDSFLMVSDIRRLQQKTIAFRNHLYFCVPVQRAKRIVFVERSEIHSIEPDGQSFVTLEGETIPLIWVEEVISKSPRIVQDTYSLMIFAHNESNYGIPMSEFLGIHRMPENYQTEMCQPGVLGSTVINGKTHLALDLLGTVDLLMKQNGSYVEILKQDESHGSYKILCAEDDSFFASELCSTLKAHGFETFLFADGLEAKQALENKKFAETIDIIVTDLEMPRMTGLSLLRWIRGLPYLSRKPSIAYTAITTDEMRKKVLNEGAVDFISKMSLDELVERCVEYKDGRQVAEEARKTQTVKNEKKIRKMDRIVTFKLGEHWFGLHMDNIKEVSPAGQSAKVSTGDNWMSNITSFRGQFVPILHLGAYFDMEEASKFNEQAVVESGGNAMVLRVQRIGEVILMTNLNFGDGVAHIGQSQERVARHIQNICRYRDMVIAILSAESLLSIVVERKEVRSNSDIGVRKELD
ncbi:MAG: chemotaxis protein CheW [Zetaproteobacteria bacterium]|nr:chemotaxis protein CheW [Zetaproteobacteria bacterium]